MLNLNMLINMVQYSLSLYFCIKYNCCAYPPLCLLNNIQYIIRKCEKMLDCSYLEYTSILPNNLHEP